MKLRDSITDKLDIRPGEARPLAMACLGSFLMLAFLTLARSLREALYLTTFDVSTLPYITAGAVVASLPAVAVFTAMAGRFPLRRLLTMVGVGLAIGSVALWPHLGRSGVAVILFYLMTAVGVMLLTSGFWMLTSEIFAVRDAKRLFALIGAGGTAGAMVMGGILALMNNTAALVLMVALPFAFLASQWLQPKSEAEIESGTVPPRGDSGAGESEAGRRWPKGGNFDSLRLVFGNPHLRTIALIVMIATTASTLVDFQFKEMARASISETAALTRFFGAFYGWAGAIALAVQLAVSSRLLAKSGVSRGLGVLPLFLLVGTSVFLFVPGLASITLLRGSDNALRKSVYRPVVEFLYVPLPAALRRRTKTFIDTIVDGAAEGLGALVVFLWVTLSGLPSRALSAMVLALSLAMLAQSRRMGAEYFSTIVDRLKQEGGAAVPEPAEPREHQKDLLSATFTRMDLQAMVGEMQIGGMAGGDDSSGPDIPPDPGPATPLERLRSADDRIAAGAVSEIEDWDDEHLAQLIRLLARDGMTRTVVAALGSLEDRALDWLIAMLADEEADFVIRRRIPSVLAETGGERADDALLDALGAGRFEVRYKAAVALVRRRRRGLPLSLRDRDARVWAAVRAEVRRDRPIWELQRILDATDVPEDGLVAVRVGVRGELSLEHTFRMLSLVLDPETVRAAFEGVLLSGSRLKSFALEYLEQALPEDVRRRLWLFIGDVSEYARRRQTRSLDEVAGDLMETRATLFADKDDRDALRRMVADRDGPPPDEQA